MPMPGDQKFMSSDQIKREIDAQWLELSEQLRAEIGEAMIGAHS